MLRTLSEPFDERVPQAMKTQVRINDFVLFCFVLFCFVLFCFVLFCFVLFCFVLFCYILSSSEIMLTLFQAYAMKTLNTQLGSWAQLRHDNSLYVEEDEDMGFTCSYPGFIFFLLANYQVFINLFFLFSAFSIASRCIRRTYSEILGCHGGTHSSPRRNHFPHSLSCQQNQKVSKKRITKHSTQRNNIITSNVFL